LVQLPIVMEVGVVLNEEHGDRTMNWSVEGPVGREDNVNVGVVVEEVGDAVTLVPEMKLWYDRP
jgi:hypothetical protein